MPEEAATALPVRVSADARLQAQLVPYLEGTLGWQVTRGDELPAVLELVGVGAVAATRLPTVLLVRDDDPPDRSALAASRASRHVDVVRWPAERQRLGEVASGLLDRASARADTAATAATVRVGGSGGGVGTTTVVLGLAGLLAWHGQPVLVVAAGDVPVPDVPVVDPAALGAHRTWEAAVEVAGVPLLRVLAAHRGPRAPVAVPEGTVVLRDDGVAVDVDVLVCVRDRAGLDALDATTAAAAVVVDRGVVTRAAWVRATGRTVRQVHLDWSVRVGRAGLLRRVPASLPGRWLAPLAPLAQTLLG